MWRSNSLRSALDGISSCADRPSALVQMELWAALARFERIDPNEIRRLAAARLCGHDLGAPKGCDEVDDAIGECLRTGCSIRSIWRALSTGTRMGELMLHAYRDGFEAGYIDSMEGSANSI